MCSVQYEVLRVQGKRVKSAGKSALQKVGRTYVVALKTGHSAVRQCSAVQCSTVQLCSVQYNTERSSNVQTSIMQCGEVQ